MDRMDEFIIWLYKKRDKVRKETEKEKIDSEYLTECFAKIELLNKIIKKVNKIKKGKI